MPKRNGLKNLALLTLGAILTFAPTIALGKVQDWREGADRINNRGETTMDFSEESVGLQFENYVKNGFGGGSLGIGWTQGTHTYFNAFGSFDAVPFWEKGSEVRIFGDLDYQHFEYELRRDSLGDLIKVTDTTRVDALHLLHGTKASLENFEGKVTYENYATNIFSALDVPLGALKLHGKIGFSTDQFFEEWDWLPKTVLSAEGAYVFHDPINVKREYQWDLNGFMTQISFCEDVPILGQIKNIRGTYGQYYDTQIENFYNGWSVGCQIVPGNLTPLDVSVTKGITPYGNEIIKYGLGFAFYSSKEEGNVTEITRYLPKVEISRTYNSETRTYDFNAGLELVINGF